MKAAAGFKAGRAIERQFGGRSHDIDAVGTSLELLQDAVQPETMGALLLERLRDPRLQAELVESFTEIHRNLARDASRRAASALAELLPAISRSAATIDGVD